MVEKSLTEHKLNNLVTVTHVEAKEPTGILDHVLQVTTIGKKCLLPDRSRILVTVRVQDAECKRRCFEYFLQAMLVNIGRRGGMGQKHLHPATNVRPNPPRFGEDFVERTSNWVALVWGFPVPGSGYACNSVFIVSSFGRIPPLQCCLRR